MTEPIISESYYWKRELLRTGSTPKAAQDWVLNQLLDVEAALKWFPARRDKYSRRRLGDWTHLIRELRIWFIRESIFGSTLECTSEGVIGAMRKLCLTWRPIHS